MPGWVPDRGWTGAWAVPELLQHPVTDHERTVLATLSRSGVGPTRLARMLEGAERIADLLGGSSVRVSNTMTSLDAAGVRVLVPSDDEYPAELAEIDAPPLVLYVRGQPLDTLRPAVAVVGARACTTGAARFTERLGEAFASSGFIVVSGLARGVDAAAHRGALDAGRTIAVLGSGIATCYPPEHKGLAERVAISGALVSEFPPNIGPRAWHFPARNRIISGLSCAVVVVEAGLRSGALITAGFALDHGRQVFACTTGPENPAGSGVRAMLRDGAPLIVDPDHAVEQVSELVRDQEFAFGVPVARAERVLDLEPHLRAVYDAVAEDVTVDEIVAAGGLDASRVPAALAELELEGVLEIREGRWRRKR